MRPSRLGAGHRLRAPRPTDAEEVLALLVARDRADIGAPDTTLENLRDEWRGAGFELAADARVAATADGRIVGYAAMSREVTMLVVVAPDHEGRGVGSLLRVWAEQRDYARGSTRHRQWIAASNVSARRLLIAAGYRPDRSYWRLARKLDAVEEGAAPHLGVSLRPVDVDPRTGNCDAPDRVRAFRRSRSSRGPTRGGLR